MSLHDELLDQAKHLATKESKRPKQASLRRAVSAGYYALFHLLTSDASRAFVSDDKLVALVNRTYDHNEMRKVSGSFARGEYPSLFDSVKASFVVGAQLTSVAKTFVRLQQARHEADYDLSKNFSRSEALDLIAQVEQAFQDWKAIRKEDLSRLYLASFLNWKIWDKPSR